MSVVSHSQSPVLFFKGNEKRVMVPSHSSDKHNELNKTLGLLLDPYSGKKQRRRFSLVRSERLMNSKMAPDCFSPNALSPSSIVPHNYKFTNAHCLPIRCLFEANGDQDLSFNAHMVQFIKSNIPLCISKRNIVLMVTDINLYIIKEEHIVDIFHPFREYQRIALKDVEFVSVSNLQDSFIQIHSKNESMLLYTEKKTELIQVLSEAIKHSSNISLLSSNYLCLKVEVRNELYWKHLKVLFRQLKSDKKQIDEHSSKVFQVGNDCWMDWGSIKKGNIHVFVNIMEQVEKYFFLELLSVYIKESKQCSSDKAYLIDEVVPSYPSSMVPKQDSEQILTENSIDITEEPMPIVLLPPNDTFYSVKFKFLVTKPFYNCRLIEKVETVFKRRIFCFTIGDLQPLEKQKSHSIQTSPKQVYHSKISYTRVTVTLYGNTRPDDNDSEKVLLCRSFLFDVERMSRQNNGSKKRYSVSSLRNILHRLL